MPRRKKGIPKGWSPFNNLVSSNKPLPTNRDLRIPNIFDRLPLDVLLLIIIECISVYSYTFPQTALCMFGRLQRVCRKWRDLLTNPIHPLLEVERNKYLYIDRSLLKAYQEDKQYFRLWNLETQKSGVTEMEYDLMRNSINDSPMLECHFEATILKIPYILQQFRLIFRELMELARVPSTFNPEIGVIYPYTYYVNGVVDGCLSLLIPVYYHSTDGDLITKFHIQNLYPSRQGFCTWHLRLSFNHIISLFASFYKVEIYDMSFKQYRQGFYMTYRYPSEFKVEKIMTKP